MESNVPIIPIDEQFKIIADTAPALNWIANADKLFCFFNTSWLRYTGRTFELEYGNGWTEGVHPDDLKQCQDLYSRSFDAREQFKIEYRLRRHDGEYLWLLNHGVPRYTAEGTFAGYTGSCMVFDETLNPKKLNKHSNHTDALNSSLKVDEPSRSEHIMRSVVQNASFPVAVYSGKEMRIWLANQASLDLWEVTNEVIGQLYEDMFLEIGDQRVFVQLQEVFATGEPLHVWNQRHELIVNGKPITSYFNYNFTALRDQSGEIYGVMSTAINVTDEFLAKLRVEQSEKNLHNIIHQSPVGMCILKGQPLFVEEANDVFLEIIGKERGQFNNTPYWVVNAEVAPDYESVTDKVMETAETFNASEHKVNLIRNGIEEVVYVNFVFQPIKDINGAVEGIVIIAIDVTDEVNARTIIQKSSLERAVLNEELAAANEEMAATNEEINTVNEELIHIQKDLHRIIDELKESESRLSMAIEATSLGTWDYNLVKGTMFWSEESKSILGIPSDRNVDFLEFLDHIFSEDQERVDRQLSESIEAGSNGHYDISCRVVRFDDGSIRWIRVQGTIFFGINRRPIRYLGTVLDMTTTKLAQEALVRSEKLFKSIAVNIPGSLVIVINKDERYITIEGDLMQRVGVDNQNYKGEHISQVGTPEFAKRLGLLYQQILLGEKISMEQRSSGGDYYMVHLIPLKDEFGEVENGLIIALDITDIKEAEVKSAKHAAIIESTDDAIISKTLDSVITSWNKSAERIFGYAAEEIIGETIYKLIPIDRQDEEPNILRRLKNGERIEHFETKRIKKDGTLIDVSITISPVKDKSGNIIGLSKIARDITERKKDEIRKNDFIGMVSHELKTPLTSLNAIVQVAHLKLNTNEDRFLSTAMFKASIQVKRMSAMINGFLNISRLESGKMLIEKSSFEIGKVIQEVIEEVEMTVTTHKVNFESCDLVEVYADHDKISSVISNLIGNAIKYSPKAKLVEVKCEVVDAKVIVSIRDEGMGITPKDTERIFDRYYRVEGNHMQHIAGFGIGLYLSAEIIKHQGGDIWVQSQIDNGSTFYFSLPIIN